MFHIFIFQESEKITDMEEEGNVISISSEERLNSKEHLDTQLNAIDETNGVIEANECTQVKN